MTIYRLLTASEHALPNWLLVNFSKKSFSELTLSVRSSLDFYNLVRVCSRTFHLRRDLFTLISKSLFQEFQGFFPRSDFPFHLFSTDEV